MVLEKIKESLHDTQKNKDKLKAGEKRLSFRREYIKNMCLLC